MSNYPEEKYRQLDMDHVSLGVVIEVADEMAEELEKLRRIIDDNTPLDRT